MPADNKLLRELLEDARRMRTPEEKAAFGEKLMSTGENRVSPLQRRTPDQVKNLDVFGGSARPADFIQPYYGEKFPTEVAKAMLYNARLPKPALEEKAYSKLYDTIEFKRNPTEPYGDTYDKTTRLVELGNREAERISLADAKLYQEYQGVEPKEEYQKAIKDSGRNMVRQNSYGSMEDYVAATSDSAAEHEFSHHATIPEKGDSVVDDAYFNALYMGGGSGDTKDPAAPSAAHTFSPAETTQAAARLQREWFAKTGSRIEKPDDFLKMVESGDQYEFLTPEAKRFLNYARNIRTYTPEGLDKADKERHEKYRAKTLKALADILPATVSTDDSFQSRVNERIGALPT